MMSPISVRVCDEVHGVEKVYQLQQPFAMVGPGAGMDVMLPAAEDAKPRRFYLQAVDAGVVAVELGGQRAPDHHAAPARLIRTGEPLRIGHYAVMAERSPINHLPAPSTEVARRPAHFSNGLVNDTWLYFVNGHSRTTRKSVRHLRETLTLIGRSKSCHLKLSHPRVSRFQCSIVRNDSEIWAVCLSRQHELRVNGHPVTNGRLTIGDILSVGPFRMQLQQGGAWPDLPGSGSAAAQSRLQPTAHHHTAPSFGGRAVDCKLVQGDSHEWDAVSCASDSDVMSLVQQFTAVQQLLMAQSQQQASMLLHLIRNVQLSQDSQQGLLKEQIETIQNISDELQAWRTQLEREAVAVPPRRIENQFPANPPAAVPPPPAAHSQGEERIPRTAEEIRAHASLSERINFLERERKSIVQKILRLLPGCSEIDT